MKTTAHTAQCMISDGSDLALVTVTQMDSITDAKLKGYRILKRDDSLTVDDMYDAEDNDDLSLTWKIVG